MLRQKPSAKIKRRYLLVKGNKEDIERAILEYIGTLGWAKASPVFVSVKKGECVLAVDRRALSDVRAAFSLSKKLEVLGVSGTIKGLKRRI